MKSKKGFTILEIIIVAVFASLLLILFFIQKANTYKSSIWIEKEDRRVNAKSLLGVLSMGIVKGTTVTLIADGEDEDEALNGLEHLIVSELND